MMRVILVLLLAASLAQPAWKPSKKWLVSVGALVAANVADIHSTQGRYEANPLLRSPDGRLRARGIGIKFGIAAGLIAGEALLLRKCPSADKAAAVVNFSAAGVVGGLAVRNYGVNSGHEQRSHAYR